jgi:hypothetical protein
MITDRYKGVNLKGRSKKMQNGEVVLRLRVVRLKSSEYHLTDIVTVIAGDYAVNLDVSKSEWAVFHLASEHEPIKFLARSANASCLCHEICGRKRIDFPKNLSILIEGYWVDRLLDTRVVDTRIPGVRRVWRDCEVSFPATHGESLDEEDDTKVDTLVCFSHLKDTPPKNPRHASVPDGPVAIALNWLKEYDDAFGDYNGYPTPPMASRVLYSPPEGMRLTWEPGMTKRPLTFTNHTTTLDKVIKAVEFSVSLDKYYIL